MSSADMKAYLLGIVGAAIGAALGYAITYALLQNGLYAPLFAQAALGAGAGMLARRRLVPLGILCAFAGLVFGLFLEWRFFPFIADQSLGYFVTHIHKLTMLHLIFIAVGTFFSYRLSVGFDRGTTTE